MSLFTIVLISISLAMDAFAVAVSAGLSQKKIHIKQAILLASVFGIFQAFMPLIWWAGWLSLEWYIQSISEWIASFILFILGGKMIYEALSGSGEEKRDYFSFVSLVSLGIATSIDALAVWVSFALLPVNILWAVGLIWGITFFICLAWVVLGAKFGHIFEKKAEILWGFILIGIASKILIEYFIKL